MMYEGSLIVKASVHRTSYIVHRTSNTSCKYGDSISLLWRYDD